MLGVFQWIAHESYDQYRCIDLFGVKSTIFKIGQTNHQIQCLDIELDNIKLDNIAEIY